MVGGDGGKKNLKFLPPLSSLLSLIGLKLFYFIFKRQTRTGRTNFIEENNAHV